MDRIPYAEAQELLEDVLDCLTEVGNGTTDEELWIAKAKLFKFRDEFLNPLVAEIKSYAPFKDQKI